MSDVAQILGLAGPKTGANGASASDLDQLKPSGTPLGRGKQTSSSSKQKKLTGMQREVLELLESNHRASHALYQGFGKTSLKQKWQERKKSPAVKWIRKSFRNPARAALAGENGVLHLGVILFRTTHALVRGCSLQDGSTTSTVSRTLRATTCSLHTLVLLKYTGREEEVGEGKLRLLWS